MVLSKKGKSNLFPFFMYIRIGMIHRSLLLKALSLILSENKGDPYFIHYWLSAAADKKPTPAT
ncbi:hypothetical protein CHU_2774 [Cytophaga hutchinsonii ATCC 33406]|uniref:Uncharacterized protein n=1 Tax=Cytophaga hutchinsonii (strain ATCC 33406 / DSM 1761 / CIP 103989 / NBRC 15051 / NCIMB 9469 / D465) TaxID=269798 RepID=A0A6N4SU56_CYTH3|nr:hypothetical protein CHU_2774 [Cytophaga hutchinsonii ATCC 33406]